MDATLIGGNALPYDLEAEASVLGAVLIDNDAIVKISDKLTPEDFYDARHNYIYGAIKALYEDRKAIDVLTLSNQLKAEKRLSQIGGAAYLTELTNFVPTASHVESYAELVAEKSVRRQIMRINKELSLLAQDETKKLKDLIELAEAEMMKVGQQQTKQGVISLEQILVESFERLDELHKDKKKIRGIPTGFKDLDDILAGFQRSDLIVLAARPSMGKSALAVNLARNVAVNTHEPVLIFTLEMSKDQIADRLLSIESGVNAWSIRNGNLTDSDYEKIGQALGPLGEAPIYIDDTPGVTVSDLRTKARREAHQHPLGLIIVDYLQLMSGGGRYASEGNRVQEISEISRGLKGVARELNVPVLALSQLSRSVESRPDKIPQLADLRESGAIEQDADVVAFIYREEYYNPETDRKKITDILVKKHRNGPTGNVELYFDNEKQRFRSLDTKRSAKGDPFAN